MLYLIDDLIGSMEQVSHLFEGFALTSHFFGLFHQVVHHLIPGIPHHAVTSGRAAQQRMWGDAAVLVEFGHEMVLQGVLEGQDQKAHDRLRHQVHEVLLLIQHRQQHRQQQQQQQQQQHRSAERSDRHTQ